MRSIQALPESVHSSMRSGTILFDLTRVVEELVFNSIDASATQVSVSVGVGTSSIKVTDNGHGITRDGLELLGERYATSKFEKSTVWDNVSRTFGFHGEALGSISDVSLLEIVSKAHGMPNGYRKVIKGCKCLYLGIDDNRHDVGTTVIVRDLFYNQPVRRKHLQSSPKRVLHSVKESILRIALVHLKISFKVIDIESGDKLLSTSPSTSPLPLLMSGFGVEISSCLRELGVSDGGLKLSGYISVPSEVTLGKGFQYFYINSRFISKGPIQKLLNQLSARFSCSEILKDNIDSRTWKRSRFQTCPTYILNLSCPRAHYDMTFEPSKTSVVFKDWDPVLAFIEKVVTSFWSKSIPYGPVSHGADTSHKEDIWKEADTNSSTANDLLENYGLRKRRCITQCQQVPCDLLSPQPKSLRPEVKHMSVGNKTKFSYEEDLQVEDGTGMGFPLETNCSIKSCKPVAQSKTIVPEMTGSDTGVPAPYISSLDDLCSENKFLGGKSYEQDHLSSSMRGGAFEGNTRNGLTARKLFAGSFAVVDGIEGNEHFNKSFLRSCSFHTARLPDGDSIANDTFGFQGGGSRAGKKSLDIADIFDIGEVDENNLDPEPLQDEAAAVWPFPSLTTTCNVDILLRSTQDDPALETDFNKTDGLRAGNLSADCSSDREQDNKHVKDTFPTLLTDKACMTNGVFKFEADGYKTKLKLTNGCDMFDIGEVGDNKGAGQLQDDTANVWSSPQIASTSGMDIDSDILLKVFSLPYPLTGECSDENSLQAEAFMRVRHFGSRCQSSKSCWSPSTLDPLLIDKRHGVDDFLDEDMFERRFKYQRNAEFDHFADTKGAGDVFSHDRMQFSPSKKDCFLSSYSSAPSACKDYSNNKGDIKEFLRDGVLFSENYLKLPDEPEWMYFKSLGKACTFADAACDISSLSCIDGERDSRIQAKFKRRMHDFQIQPRRSHSAPPFYRGKKKIFSLKIWQTVKIRKPQFVTNNDTPSPEEASYLKHIQASSGGDHLPLMEGVGSAPLDNSRLEVKQNTDTMEIPDSRLQEDQSNVLCNIDSDFTSKETQGELDFGLKWRSNCSLTAKFEKVGNSCIQDNILDLSSGLLHLSGDSLVPDSISKKCLGDAKVLHQVDKKFIPIVAGRTVAIIDQHAADERIRLEDLRQKVLSGEMKSITYLDAEKELVLPEIGYQLLHNYAEQIQKWGWICNFHAQSSTSFKKSLNFLHSQPSVATLLAVPCILGVSLTDVDLLEFLQQLADTDGSSGIPPAVRRVLNYKACRGAIMFGDALLPSECSLIVEELKQTSLCFQCAHGRPTTVPLVDLALLHKHIAKLERWSSCSNESWHGLTRHKPSLERAARRLNSD